MSAEITLSQNPLKNTWFLFNREANRLKNEQAKNQHVYSMGFQPRTLDHEAFCRPPPSTELHEWPSPLYKDNVRYACEWKYFSLKGRKQSPGLVTFFLMICILYLSHTYWLFWTLPELWREIKPVYSFTSQFQFKQNDQNCPNLFFSPLNLLARQC